MAVAPWSPAELASARADMESAMLTEVCQVRRRPPGGAWQTIAADVPCFLEIVGATASGPTDGMTGGERRMGARLDVPVGTDIREGDVALLADWRFECEGLDPDATLLLACYGRSEHL